MRRTITPAMLAAGMFLMPPSAAAMEASGVPKITDGDTLSINGQKVRLYGIDAFENGQSCERGSRRYNCGLSAENALQTLSQHGVRCTGDSFDDYDRLLAVCYAGDIEINAALVETGHALAFRRYALDYIAEEDRARQSSAGAWAGTFTPPWKFRSARWTIATGKIPNAACPIKGNINRKGERVYHVPRSRSYTRTKVSIEPGERWFCDEAEAEAAGWRAPHR